MAEALGVAAGVAGLVSLTIEVFGISYKYVNGVRNASSSARQFLNELQNLQIVLQRIEQEAQQNNELEVFGEAGSCLVSIKESNEYIDLLQKVRDRLQQRQTSSSIRNSVKALTWPFSKEETLDLTNSLHRHLEIYNTALAVDSLNIEKLTLSEVKKINVFQEDSRIKAALDWLSPLNMYQKQQDTLSRRHGTTGGWLLNDPAFKGWVDDECYQRTLWCPGNPGTGKTVITSVVVDYLQNNYADKDTIVAYVYCNYKDQAAQTALNLIACLARQIIGRPKALPQQLVTLQNEVEKQNRRPSLDELKRLLISLSSHHKRTYIIVDALDECEATRERRLLLPVLESLLNPLTRLFVTSRPNNEDISATFGRATQILIAASESDLRQYVQERIDETKGIVSRSSPELKDKISSTISAEASGMFLLAALQIDRIFALRTTKEIKSALTSMPRGLDELYKATLERIEQQAGNDGPLGMRILSWITHARRPLLVDELRYGLAVEYSDNGECLDEFDEDNLLSPGSLVDVCAGLVIIDSNSQIVRLVHYTTQEYFDKARLHLFKDAEVDMSRACLTYLSYNSVTELDNNIHEYQDIYGFVEEEIFRSEPFLQYATLSWFSHVKCGLLLEDPDPIFLRVVARFKNSESIIAACEILHGVSNPSSSGELLREPDRRSEVYVCEVASLLGLEELVAVSLDHRTGPCPSLDSSLIHASYNGHLSTVKLLLQNGASIDSTVKSHANRDWTVSALEAACYGGRSSVAEFLIEKGASKYGQTSSYLPPIHLAVLARNTRIIDLLFKKGVDVDARDLFGKTPCHTAAYCYQLDSVRYLLDAGCNLELRDSYGNTVLLCCSHYPSHQSIGVIKLLLDRGADATAKDKDGKTLRDIIELKGPHDLYDLRLYDKVMEMLRQAEEKSSAFATDDSKENEPSSSGQSLALL